ncbi:hypothetical protein ACVWZM_008576 [Bradyrhizobium sp. USDA 4501]
MYALFRGKTQLGRSFATEKEVWEAALIDGLVEDVPVADELGGQILPDIASSGSMNTSRSPIGNPDVPDAGQPIGGTSRPKRHAHRAWCRQLTALSALEGPANPPRGVFLLNLSRAAKT